MEVRSDFRLALKVRDANGRTRTVGHLSHEVDESLGEGLVPHLQRVDPAGHWLASYDVDGKQIVLDAVDGSGAPSRKIAVSDAPGVPQQFRWLADGSGMVIMTSDEVFVLPFGATSSSTRPRALLANASEHPLRMMDVRVMDGGLLVRADEQISPVTAPDPLVFDSGVDLLFGDERVVSHPLELWDPDYYDLDEFDEEPINGRGQLYFVALDGTTPSAAKPLVKPDKTVTGAIPLSGGRVALQVGDFDNEMWAYNEANAMWIATPSADGWTVATRDPCEDGCSAGNWAPGATVPIYADYDEIVVGGDDPYTLEAPEGGPVNVLWADDARDLLMAGTNERLALWHDGAMRWEYEAPKGDLHSARFSPSGKHVWAITDAEIMRFSVADGKRKRVMKIRTYTRDSDQEGSEDNDWVYTSRVEYRRLDGVVPLPNGGVAFGVLEVEEETESF